MAYLLDTNVAIHLRDGDPEITDRVAALDDAVLMSIIPAVAFDVAAADAYGAIIARSGYSRRKLLDHMIAAQAIIHHAVLITMNPDDFADIVGLRVLTW